MEFLDRIRIVVSRITKLPTKKSPPASSVYLLALLKEFLYPKRVPHQAVFLKY